jgi:hypothetical protein
VRIHELAAVPLRCANHSPFTRPDSRGTTNPACCVVFSCCYTAIKSTGGGIFVVVCYRFSLFATPVNREITGVSVSGLGGCGEELLVVIGRRSV